MSGCPQCSGKIPWTLDRFLIKAKQIHNDKFDYSRITLDHIKGVGSHIPVTCKICNYFWTPIIGGHINEKSGCPQCYGNAAWTLESFLIRSEIIHGSKFDYSQIMSDHIKGGNSHIPIICKTCNYLWTPPIISHINAKSGCPQCSGRAPWNLERFLIRAEQIHGNKFDYSQITSDHIKGVGSHIPIVCKTCNYFWTPPINSHINNKNGCTQCSDNIPWTLERFRIKGNQIHNNKFDYSQITLDHIENKYSHIPIRCIKCNHIWSPRIDSHIHSKSGCPKCTHTGYSKSQIEWLESIIASGCINIVHALNVGEHKIENVGKVDGYCAETNTVYEYHGDFWHGNPDKYLPEDINPASKKTYGELYSKTMMRDQKIRDLGYNLIVRWESEE